MGAVSSGGAPPQPSRLSCWASGAQQLSPHRPPFKSSPPPPPPPRHPGRPRRDPVPPCAWRAPRAAGRARPAPTPAPPPPAWRLAWPGLGASAPAAAGGACGRREAGCGAGCGAGAGPGAGKPLAAPCVQMLGCSVPGYGRRPLRARTQAQAACSGRAAAECSTSGRPWAPALRHARGRHPAPAPAAHHRIGVSTVCEEVVEVEDTEVLRADAWGAGLPDAAERRAQASVALATLEDSLQDLGVALQDLESADSDLDSADSDITVRG